MVTDSILSISADVPDTLGHFEQIECAARRQLLLPHRYISL